MTRHAAVAVEQHDLRAVAHGTSHAPHSVLGPHVGESSVTIRTLRPLADAVVVVTADQKVAATHEQDGIWVAVLAGTSVPDYRIDVTYDSLTTRVDDPYRFLPTVGELDRHLVREGRHEELWTVLGANLHTYPSPLGDVTGTAFAVWAPNARAIRVIGDFNHWQGATHAMRSLGDSGVWELFVPGVGAGTRYKFEILGQDGSWRQKADPVAKGTEVPPATASVVVESHFAWGDDDWITTRSSSDPHTGPLSIYEVHLGSWRQGLSYRDLATQLTDYVVDLGFTHVEFMPVSEHPFGGSWGYQVSSYYAPTSRFGHPDDFRFLVDTLHRAGIGVLLDWVPAHFPKDEWALANFDGTPLYEHPDPLRGEQPDWGTLVFNFGRAEVRNFLVANATYWLEQFHVDGLRVDAVASMLYLDYSRQAGEWRPNMYGGRENLEAIAFMQEANATAYRRTPGVMMIAEESTAFPGVTSPTDAGGLGYGLKWNMGWMNDTLRYLAEAPINRRYHHHEATFSMVYAYSERFILPISHDEVVHGKGSLLRKMPGDDWQQLAGVRSLLAYQWSHPGKQLLFMGCELGQGTEWAESTGLDWYLLDHEPHRGVQSVVRDLNR
ncbi:MAG TPA: 1,4-alpha-glucan branching protein GlgB, partial [Cellulomonas sp.]|uniref:1,4-alpha-glucan branching protein GlgB n=1 Tax=Cellulomonas sp. TaxID=40001 RepID=UPI002E2EB594